MKQIGEKLNGDLLLEKELRFTRKHWTILGVIFSIVFILLIVSVFLMGAKIKKVNFDLTSAHKRIDSLLDANNSLVNKVIELKEKEQRITGNIENYIIKINKTIPQIVVKEIAKNIIIASDTYNLPITTIVAVMERESHFNPTLISKAGARGLMQVMPTWVKEKELGVDSRFDFHDVEKGINAGAYVLRKYLKNNNNNMKKALLQYVHYDKQYVKDVYNSMGKFVVFKGLFKEKIKGVVLELDEDQDKPDTLIHTVVKGDTLSLIAQKYTGSILNWKKIHKLNPDIMPTRMQIGTEITVPININMSL